MKRTTKLAIAVGLALGLGTAVVVAQPYGYGPGMGGGYGYGPGWMHGGGGYGPGWMHGGFGPGGGYGPGMMGYGPGGFGFEDRLAAQKAALNIKPEQEGAWKAYADVATKQFDAAAAQREAFWKSAPGSSAERYELHSKFMAQRAESEKAVSAAYKKLYSALTPEQKTIADQGGAGYGYGPRGRGR